MGQGPWRWIVLFFTRPIRFSDLAALARPLKQRETTREPPDPMRAADAAEDRPSLPRAPAEGSASARPRTVSLRDPLEVGISEQPLDTLPAELRSEFDSIAKREAERARSRERGAEG